MHKENALFIGFNILLLIIFAVLTIMLLPGMFNKEIVPLIFAGAVGIAGNLVSLKLMKKNAPELKKYNIPFFLSVIISVLYYRSSVLAFYDGIIRDIAAAFIVVVIPIIVWLLILLFALKNFKERIIVILSSPMIYFAFFCMMVLLSLYIEPLKFW